MVVIVSGTIHGGALVIIDRIIMILVLLNGNAGVDGFCSGCGSDSSSHVVARWPIELLLFLCTQAKVLVSCAHEDVHS